MLVVKWSQNVLKALNEPLPDWDLHVIDNATIGVSKLSHARLPSRIPLPESVMIEYSEFRHKIKHNVSIQIVCAPDGSTLTPLGHPRKGWGVHATFQAPALATIFADQRYNLPPQITIAIHKPVLEIGDLWESTDEVWSGNDAVLPPNLQHFSQAVHAALAKLTSPKGHHKHYYTKDNIPPKKRKSLLWSPITYDYPNPYGDSLRETCKNIAIRYFPEIYFEPISFDLPPLANFGLAGHKTIGDLAFGSYDLFGIFIFGTAIRNKLAAFQYIGLYDRQVTAKCRALVRHSLETLKILDVIKHSDKQTAMSCFSP